MINRNLQALLLCGSFICILSVHAQDKDVDQADTLDFEAFHKDKKEAVKVWNKDTSAPMKAYNDATTTPPTADATTPVASNSISGKRFEIRERYTLTRSVKTPYSAFYVLEPLAKQSAQLCPRGWQKLAERSEPIEQDYYLYYVIECL